MARGPRAGHTRCGFGIDGGSFGVVAISLLAFLAGVGLVEVKKSVIVNDALFFPSVRPSGDGAFRP